MSSVGSFTIGDHATVIIGDHAAAGPGARAEHREGLDSDVLLQVLRELIQTVNAQTSHKENTELDRQVGTLAEEAAREKPDAGRVKTALDVIKSGADGLENGGKIIGLCNKAYNIVAPMLGLPPSPLP
jgi:hypothetical protein